MTNLRQSPAGAPGTRAASSTPSLTAFLTAVGALTVVRLIGLQFSVVDLYVDESQYWSWSRELAFGYYSKPPMIAWVIAAADAVCGSGEACVRAPAAILYFGTSVLVYAIGLRLYGGTVAFFAGLTVALAPGVAFSARIVSTDVPLLFFWALALFAWLQLVLGGSRRWAVVLGAAFGFGLLSKYAMAYFVPCAVLAGLVEPRARRLLAAPALWIAFAAGALFLVPNIIWNLANGLVTMAATGRNIAESGVRLEPANALEFVASQFVLVGPIVFATLLVLAVRIRSSLVTADDRLMLAFSLPIYGAITARALIAEANANWAAAGAISAFVVATAILVRTGRLRLIAAGLAIGAVCQAGLLVGDRFANRVTVPALASPDVYRRTIGWRALGVEVARIIAARGARSIVADGRADVAALLYYAADGPTVYAWPQPGARPQDHFELTRPLPADAPEPILAIDMCTDPDRFAAQFGSVARAGSITVPTGPTSTRTHAVFLLADRRAMPAAPGPCPP